MKKCMVLVLLLSGSQVSADSSCCMQQMDMPCKMTRSMDMSPDMTSCEMPAKMDCPMVCPEVCPVACPVACPVTCPMSSDMACDMTKVRSQEEVVDLKDDSKVENIDWAKLKECMRKLDDSCDSMQENEKAVMEGMQKLNNFKESSQVQKSQKSLELVLKSHVAILTLSNKVRSMLGKCCAQVEKYSLKIGEMTKKVSDRSKVVMEKNSVS